MTNKKLFFIIFILLTVLFCYFRLKPIYFQTVPYTFDQGRDFLKAQEIVRDKNITFIGPTTGVQGIFHGAWWYYFLAIPYFLFQGNPTGFIFFIFLMAFIQFILFTVFIKKYFNTLSALFFATLIVASPYFISTSFFAIGSVLTPPFILILFFSLYKFLEKKEGQYLFLLFLGLGFILETELPFGLFIIPSFFISVIFLKELKNFFSNIKSVIYALFGLIIPIIPRALFELKNNFLQLKTLFGFIIHPHIYNPKTFTQRIIERYNLFYDYYISLFPDKNIVLVLGAVLILVVGLIVGYKKFSLVKKRFAKLIFLTFFLLFVLSLFYRDNFWPNYYEGLPYFYSLFLALGVYGFQKKRFKGTFLNNIPLIYILIIIIFAIIILVKDTKAIRSPEITGMKTQITAVENIYKNVGANEFCVRIYTPPVIPYTYDYLFSYYSQRKGLKYPANDFINNQCYFIMEKEQEGYLFQQRIVKWRAENTPKNAALIKKAPVNKSVTIELWKKE